MTRRGGTRALVALGAAVVVAVLVALVPHVRGSRPSLGPGESYGVDVSHHQGAIDWRAVADDGVRYAYAKASEGSTMRDDRFASNWRDGRAAGIRMGAYHFFSLCRTGEDQASNFLTALRAADAVRGDLPPAVDLEFDGNCDARPPATDLDRKLGVFLQRVEAATGRPALLYVFDDFEQRYPLAAYGDRGRWVRRLVWRPDGGWCWWQASDTARVRGIAGDVDLNVVRRG